MELIKILVCGGRHFEEYAFFEVCLDSFLDKYGFEDRHIEIVSGGCEGTDKLAERFAKEHNCAMKIFPANWKLYGKAAGPIRNKQMIEYIKQAKQKFVVAFTSANSKGTLGTISLAKKFDIPVYQIDYETSEIVSPLYEGILYNPTTKEFDFDWSLDTPEDVVHLTQTKIGATKFRKRMYYFGYKINTNGKVDKEYKKLFLQFIKSGVNNDSRITEMVSKCVECFYTASEITNFDYIAKLPSQSKLNALIVELIKEFDDPQEVELIKKPTEELEFDWDKFKENFKGDEEYFNKFYAYINNYIATLKKNPYFSISKVRRQYRKYLKPMLIFGEDKIENTQNTNLLLIDDIMSSRSSLDMAINLLDQIDFKGTITILTLINNRYS